MSVNKTERLIVDTSEYVAKMKDMHSVNNVPAGDFVRDGMNNYKAFAEAKIPYCRNHDAAGYYEYCGEFIVDVHRIFRDFDADVDDETSYDFEYTDKYVQAARDVGSEVFYRLGAMIEHYKKVGTYPPKDFHKWARICEHIIRHYNEGWSNGFQYNLKYWEIWNEPECRNSDGSNPCWQGTLEQFNDFFVIVFKHLKQRFPNLHIGGPAYCGCWRDGINHDFFDILKKNDITLDFFSFHGYHREPSQYYDDGEHAYELLCEYGVQGRTELILDEWNYVNKWTGQEFIDSIYAIKGLKGASFIAGTMAAGQASKLDHMMYYDARPCTWNGMFDTTFLTPLKGYYPFKMYGEMYGLKKQILTKSESEHTYAVGASDGKMSCIMATYFDNDSNAQGKEVEVEISGMKEGNKTVEYYLLDENHDCELVKTEKTKAKTKKTTLRFDLYSTWYIKVLE